MQNKNAIFLGKSGKIFGPFPQNEFDQMFADGSLSNYFWIWDRKREEWKPIETPPPPPPSAGKSNDNTRASSLDWGCLEAVCFNRSDLINGKLECVTESGCMLISNNRGSDQKFPIHHSLELNIYDPSNKKSTSVRVSIADVRFENHQWIYRLKWEAPPKL